MKLAVLCASLLGSACLALPAPEGQALDPRAMSVIERTKTTTQPYRAYYWNVITLSDGRKIEEWSAEFNRGLLHRVETPRDRVVADCGAMTGSHFSIGPGTVVSGPDVAKTACGIAMEKVPIAARFVERVSTIFGPADRVEVTDADLIRTYDISDDGIILKTIFRANRDGRPVVLTLEPQAIERVAPSSDMFAKGSLTTSFMAEAYKVRQPPS